MSKKYSIYFWVFIVLFICFNGYRALKKNWNFADPIDLRGIWVGSQLLDSSADFYNNEKGRQLWMDAKEKEGFTSHSDFGDKWVSIAVYPPNTFTLFYFIGEFNWTNARIVWWILCGTSLLFFCFLISRWTNAIWPVGLILAMSATFFAISLGQPMLLCVLLIAYSIYIHEKQPILAGILLGASMFKFTLVLPLLFWLLGKRQWTVLFTCAATAVAVILPVLLVNSNSVFDYLAQADNYYKLVHHIHPENTYTFSNSELVGVLNFYFGWNPSNYKWLPFILMIGSSIWLAILLFKVRISSAKALLGLYLLSFVLSYHLSYDILIFIIPLIALDSWKWKYIIIAALLFLSLPINAVFPDQSILKFNYPLVLFIGLVIYLIAIRNDLKVTS